MTRVARALLLQDFIDRDPTRHPPTSSTSPRQRQQACRSPDLYQLPAEPVRRTYRPGDNRVSIEPVTSPERRSSFSIRRVAGLRDAREGVAESRVAPDAPPAP